MIKEFFCWNCGFIARFSLTEAHKPGIDHRCPFCSTAGQEYIMCARPPMMQTQEPRTAIIDADEMQMNMQVRRR